MSSEVFKTEIDACRFCRGVWFDAGELGPVALAFSRQSGLKEARHNLPRVVVNPDQVDEPARPCPRCSTSMSKSNYAGDSNIILDRCAPCGGLWCDGGELDALVSHVKGREDLRHMGRGVMRHLDQMHSLRELQELCDELRQPASPMSWYVMPWLIPLGDNPATYGTPWVVLGLIAANMLSYFAQLALVPDLLAWVQLFGFVPSHLLAGEGIQTLITSMFVHAGFWHLAGNMLFLWIFGDNVEESFGARRFALFYIGAGLLGSLVHVALYPASSIPGVGASGAISGVLGAYFILHPQARIRMFLIGRIVTLPAWSFLAVWFGLQLIHGVLALRNGIATGTGWWAHIGGFAFGALFASQWKRQTAALAPPGSR